MASNHVAVWPKVRVTANGKSKIVERGQNVPDGVSDVDLDNLVTFGAIAGVSGVEPKDDQSPTAVLAAVGTDKELAKVALDEERARPTPRATLVAKLEKILAA